METYSGIRDFSLHLPISLFRHTIFSGNIIISSNDICFGHHDEDEKLAQITYALTR